MLIHVLLSNLLRATKHYSRYRVLFRKLQMELVKFTLHFLLIQVSVSVKVRMY